MAPSDIITAEAAETMAARVNAMTGDECRTALMFLAGLRPDAVDMALRGIGSLRRAVTESLGGSP